MKKFPNEPDIDVPWPSERDHLAAMVYNSRAQSPFEMTALRWGKICQTFRSSARSCYEEVDRMLENGELDLHDDT